jgi:hypothetical protein
MRGIGKAGGGSTSGGGGRSTRAKGTGGIQSGGGGGMRPVATPEPGGGLQTVSPVFTGQPVATPQPVTHDPINGINPLMVSSLPPMASGADVYARQFYRGSRVPYRRYLPVSIV